MRNQENNQNQIGPESSPSKEEKNEARKIFYNKWVPWFFVIFFLIFIVVDIFYIYIAETTWRGLVTEGGYQKGLKYNQVIKYTKTQKQLGWTSDIKYEPIDLLHGNLNVRLFDANKKIVSDAKVNAKFTRPTQEGYDFSSELEFDQNTSLYFTETNFPLKGLWDVEIQVMRGDAVYQDVKRLVIK